MHDVGTLTPSSVLLLVNAGVRAPLLSFPQPSLCLLLTNPAEREPKTSTTIDLIDTICFKIHTHAHINDNILLIDCKDISI